MDVHTRSHTNERPFKCSYTVSVFTASYKKAIGCSTQEGGRLGGV